MVFEIQCSFSHSIDFNSLRISCITSLATLFLPVCCWQRKLILVKLFDNLSHVTLIDTNPDFHRIYILLSLLLKTDFPKSEFVWIQVIYHMYLRIYFLYSHDFKLYIRFPNSKKKKCIEWTKIILNISYFTKGTFKLFESLSVRVINYIIYSKNHVLRRSLIFHDNS